MLVSIGKAGWQTAKAAYDALGSTIEQGVVVTKYGHSQGPIGDLAIYEAGHPVPDEHSVRATEAAPAAVSGLCARDRVLFLVSGGGSALFERPLVPLAELEDITGQMLACGADITQINTIRKRLSGVKAGGSPSSAPRPMCMPSSSPMSSEDPPGYDRLRPRLSGQHHNGAGHGPCEPVRSDPQPSGAGLAGTGTAQGAG